MKTTRRQFLQQTSATVLGAAGLDALSPYVFAGPPRFGEAGSREAGSPRPTLVALYLRGGADPLSTVVPYGDDYYYKIRPTIAIPHAVDGAPGVIPVNRYFGFHPAMKELARLYAQKRMAVVLNTGSTHPTRSHFDAQDFMERAAPGIKSISEGWLNRYLAATRTADDRDLRAVAVQPVLPRSLRGRYPVLAVPDPGADRAMNLFASLYGCEDEKAAAKRLGPHASRSESTADRVVQTGADGIRRLRRLNAVLGAEPADDNQPAVVYPDDPLARQFRDVARIIKAGEGLEVAAIDYNGWDHHAYQGAVSGTFGRMLRTVSRAIDAFARDLGPRMDRVVVLAMSEFGRTVRENGNNGSDHGRGGYMMAVGGPVRGGRIYGRWTGLEPARLVDRRDLPVHTDFRDVFAETLDALFGFDADAHRFFPDYDARERALRFLRRVEA